MRLLASIGIARGVFDDPEILLAAVLERAPHYRAARREYAGVLLELHRYAQALAQLEPMLGEQPDHRELRTSARRLPRGSRRPRAGDRALQQHCCGKRPRIRSCIYRSAMRRRRSGARERAIESYRRAAACRPDFGDAYWSLANLKTYRFTDEELGRLRAAVAAPSTGAVDRYHLCFALGKALEDRGEYAESFALLRARQSREARREPLSPRAHREQHPPADRGLHRRVLRGARGWGSPRPRSDFHRRPAALRIDAARADPRLALASRGNAGARQRPANRQ